MINVLNLEFEECAVLTGTWVDNVFQYDLGDDSCNETCGAGPLFFWKCIVREMVKETCLLLKKDCGRGVLWNKMLWNETIEIKV